MLDGESEDDRRLGEALLEKFYPRQSKAWGDGHAQSLVQPGQVCTDASKGNCNQSINQSINQSVLGSSILSVSE